MITICTLTSSTQYYATVKLIVAGKYQFKFNDKDAWVTSAFLFLPLKQYLPSRLSAQFLNAKLFYHLSIPICYCLQQLQVLKQQEYANRQKFMQEEHQVLNYILQTAW